MSTINEQIVTGRAHRVLIDKVAKLWQRISFWTKASDVEFNDGNTAETKVGAIKGITTDLNTTETGYAADMTALAQLNSDIESMSFPEGVGTIYTNYIVDTPSGTVATPNVKKKICHLILPPGTYIITGAANLVTTMAAAITQYIFAGASQISANSISVTQAYMNSVAFVSFDKETEVYIAIHMNAGNNTGTYYGGYIYAMKIK